MDSSDDNSHDRVPGWYREIFPAGERDGFYYRKGDHAASFVDRGHHRLVVSFDNLSDAGYPYYDIEPWAAKFVRDNGWSHLGVYARGPSWYRDANLFHFLENLRDDGFFEQFGSVSLIGTSMGAFAAMAFSALAPGATVVALSPQSTLRADLVPWETRFAKGRRQDWSLAYGDAADHIGSAARVYVLYDPFLAQDRMQVERLPQENLVHLKGFGFGHKSAVVLRRMDHLKSFMQRTIEGTMTERDFAVMARDRKDLFLYRKNMEYYLEQNGREDRIPAFTAAFRRRKARMAAAKQDTAEPEPPSRPRAENASAPSAVIMSEPIDPPGDLPEMPRTRGNAWMVERRGTALRYMSDQYRGLVMGFEERGRDTLAQTPTLALATLSFGDDSAARRALPERFQYHVVDQLLSGAAPDAAARSQAVISELYWRRQGTAYRTILALDAQQPGIRAEEAGTAGALSRDLLARLAEGGRALAGWQKHLHVDRIDLSLLTGQPEASEAEADAHYAETAHSLRQAITSVTGQASYPVITVAQSAGTRTSGQGGAILAEARLDLDHPDLKFVVATPRYPYPLLPGAPGTHTPEAAAQIDELKVLAVGEIHAGREWRCPSLSLAKRAGEEIHAHFVTASPLVLEEGPHGFALQGCTNGARITGVRVARGKPIVRVFLDKPAEGPDLALSYAWGATSDGQEDRAANRGSLRDSWQADSLLRPGHRLRRYALSGCLKVVDG